MAVAMDESPCTPACQGRILPNDFSTCQVVVTLLSGSVTIPTRLEFDKEITFIIGSSQDELEEQLELTLLTMQQNDMTQITIDLNNTRQQTSYTKCTDDNTCILGIKLLSFQSVKSCWSLNPQEKLKRSQSYKMLGVELFKQSKIHMAFKKFSRALKYAILVGKEPPLNILEEVTKLKCQCYLNLGACQMQAENYSAVIDNCSKALCLDSNNIKGLYRRAQALCKLDDYTSAVEDLKKAKTLEKGNTAVDRLLVVAEAKVKSQEEKMSHAMSKMFV